MKVYDSINEKQTYELGWQLGSKLKRKDTVALYGDLGAGKTVFVKGIAAGIGIDEVITSPTFTFVNEYRSEKGLLYHFDLYRADSSDDLIDIGFYDYFTDDAICVIEWADKAEDFLPADCVKVYISQDLSKGEKCRRIKIIIP